MIQDDFGNLIPSSRTATLNERLEAGDVRMRRIEDDVSARITRWREREGLKVRGGKLGQFSAWLFKLRKQRAKIIGERYLDNVDSRGVHRG